MQIWFIVHQKVSFPHSRALKKDTHIFLWPCFKWHRITFYVAHMRENRIKNRFNGLFKIERAQIECEQFNMIVPDTFGKFGNTWPQVRLCPHSWEWLAESSWDLICPTTHSHPSTDHLELAYSILLGTSNYIFFITLILCHRCCLMIETKMNCSLLHR